MPTPATSGCTGRATSIREITAKARCAIGPSAFGIGARKTHIFFLYLDDDQSGFAANRPLELKRMVESNQRGRAAA